MTLHSRNSSTNWTRIWRWKKKHIYNESVKKCPKYQQNYIPSNNNHGNCRYHDGYVVNLDHALDESNKLTNDNAQAITQQYKLLANSGANNNQQIKPPKLMWTCCLGLYGTDSTCQMGKCGLSDDLKDRLMEGDQDEIALVQKHFTKN